MYNAYIVFETVWALDYQPFTKINHDNQRWLIQPIDGFLNCLLVLNVILIP